ncbi:hypothetical protein BS78_K023900 [Paspalum vaginatum]|uniref:BED-type domain-containing protein n=1 Tax=Paspalum vaginatum TaxID=158149 RepID=A0A9W7XD97_9POAL|nr:hypothetical protein BS78_K023900 [Paspalum vaginatum]
MTSKEGDGSGSQPMPASPPALPVIQVTQPVGNNTQASRPDVIDLEAINVRKRKDDTEEDANAKKQKKTTSPAWEHFTQYNKSVQVKGEMVEEKWVKCNYCSYEVKHNSKNGTSVFLSHTKSQHYKVAGQQLLKVEKDGSCAASVETYRYDPEASLRKFYLAIIMHEYPFNIVEHEYFVEFIKSLRPTFPIKSRTTVRKELMGIFVEEKNKLYEYFKNKRIVKFMHVEGRHSGANLAEAFTETVFRWFIEKKMFSLTLDNAAANNVAVKDVIAVLKKKSPLVCDGLFFHVRCANHILNLVARDGLKHIGNAIWAIRAFVIAVKSSPLQWEDFIKCASECGLSTARGLSLDVQTRWNSTYHMLKDAIYYRNAFERLYETNKRRYVGVKISDEEWDQAQILCKCLKRFNDITELLSGTSYPTANLFYQSFCEIKALISEWCGCANGTIREMAHSMNTKFEKYWNKSNVALAVAFFLDPRYKRKAIEFYMRKIYGSLLYPGKVEEFIAVVKQMYQAYACFLESATGPISSANNAEPNSDFMEQEDDDLQNYLYETHGLTDGEASDLEKYMAEPPVRVPKGISDKFEVLSWWRIHQEVYPVLSVLARDVLAIQASIVASESAFSAGGRVIDPFRSRLEPEIVEALVCA